MKKLITFILPIIFLGLFASVTEAITTPTISQIKISSPADKKDATASGITPDEQAKIDDLKEKVATKVAQLRSQANKTIIGEIKSIGTNSLVVTAKTGDEKVLVDNDTKIFRITRGARQTIALTNLKVDERVAVIIRKDNLVDGQTGRFIFVKTHPKNINGLVTEVNTKEETVAVINPKNETVTVDVETTTKIFSPTDGELKKLALSKINVGDRVHVNGLADEKDASRISAIHILILPGKAQGIVNVTPSPVATTTAKPSPKTTSKPTPTTTSTP